MSLTCLPARLPVDLCLLGLVAVVVAAAVFLVRDAGARALDGVVYLVVAMLFFLYGARVSPRAVAEGLARWGLRSVVLASAFVLFPTIGLLLTAAFRRLLTSELSVGLMSRLPDATRGATPSRSPLVLCKSAVPALKSGSYADLSLSLW